MSEFMWLAQSEHCHFVVFSFLSLSSAQCSHPGRVFPSPVTVWTGAELTLQVSLHEDASGSNAAAAGPPGDFAPWLGADGRATDGSDGLMYECQLEGQLLPLGF